MDLVKQNKLLKWILIVLVLFNLSIISIIWFYIVNDHGRRLPGPIGSTGLMQRDLGLSDEQAKLVDETRREGMEKSKQLRDRMDELKQRLADELFNEPTDTALVSNLINDICSTQKGLERVRFDNFKKFISICTPEQREKLKPVLEEIMTAGPPRLPPPKGKGPGFDPQNPAMAPHGMPGDKPAPLKRQQ